MSADDFRPNDVDRVMKPGPRRQMQNERAAGEFGELELDPCVESLEMDANDARGPASIAAGEQSLIERGEPAIRDGHLVVQSKRARRGSRVLRGD